MGKVTGFMEFNRASLPKQPAEERVKHFLEFESCLDDDTAKTQGARCMDCGVPFCHGETGCPTDNVIPEWNDLVYKSRWKEAFENLHSTNNFPEFTGRLCPAPCESACVLGLTNPPVSIKAIERTIADKGFQEGWVEPQIPDNHTGKKVAVIGSGPAGLAAAQQLARAGHSVTVFEKMDRIGGLLRYGIPDFKMEKWLIDRRIEQMQKEGVVFKTNAHVGVNISLESLRSDYQAIILAMGCEDPREVPVPGRELNGIHRAMDFLVQANRVVAGDQVSDQILATGKTVVVIGGGDTASDCIGIANRQGAKKVYQLDYNLEPPKGRDPSTPWPLYPKKFRTSTSQEEGVERRFSHMTKGFRGEGSVKSIYGIQVRKEGRSIVELPGTDFEIECDLVLIAIGFAKPVHQGLIENLTKEGLKLDDRGNVLAPFGNEHDNDAYATSIPGIYACGDVRRGQSIIVWAISEGRKCAARVHRYLLGKN